MAKKISITTKMLKQAEDLAAKAYSVQMIAAAMQLSQAYVYAHKEIIEAIERGKQQARQSVVNDLMNRSKEDSSSTASIYLSKKLRCFSPAYPTKTPKNIAEASQQIADLYKATAENIVDEEKATQLISILTQFIKAHEVGSLESRLEILEEKLKGK